MTNAPFASFSNWIGSVRGAPDGIITQLNWNVINIKSGGAWVQSKTDKAGLSKVADGQIPHFSVILKRSDIVLCALLLCPLRFPGWRVHFNTSKWGYIYDARTAFLRQSSIQKADSYNWLFCIPAIVWNPISAPATHLFSIQRVLNRNQGLVAVPVMIIWAS